MFDKKSIDKDDKIIYLERHQCGDVPMKVIVKLNMTADRMSAVKAYNSSIKEMEAHNEKVINMKATLFNILMSMLSTEMQNLIKGCGSEPYLAWKILDESHGAASMGVSVMRELDGMNICLHK